MGFQTKPKREGRQVLERSLGEQPATEPAGDAHRGLEKEPPGLKKPKEEREEPHFEGAVLSPQTRPVTGPREGLGKEAQPGAVRSVVLE